MADLNVGSTYVRMDADTSDFERKFKAAGILAEETTAKIDKATKAAGGSVGGGSSGGGGGGKGGSGIPSFDEMFPGPREALNRLTAAEAERRQAAQKVGRDGGGGGGGGGGGRGGGGGMGGEGGLFAALPNIAAATFLINQGLSLIRRIAGVVEALDNVNRSSISSREETDSFRKSRYLDTPSEKLDEYDKKIAQTKARIAELAESKSYYANRFDPKGTSLLLDPVQLYYKMRYETVKEMESRNIKLLNDLDKDKGNDPGAQVAARNRRIEAARFGIDRARSIIEQQTSDFGVYDQTFRTNESAVINRTMKQQLNTLRTIAGQASIN